MVDHNLKGNEMEKRPICQFPSEYIYLFYNRLLATVTYIVISCPGLGLEIEVIKI